jgi:hypothetical protein
MPDMDFDSDAMLAFFGQMGKEIDNFKVKIVSLNEAGSAMKKMTDHTEQFGQTIQRHVRGSMRGMEDGLAGLVGSAGGVVKLALIIGGIGKALDHFAVGELHTRNFAINTGFATDSLKKMRVQLSAAGIDANEAAQGIGSIGAKLQDVLALQETSSFYKALQASEPAMAENVRQLMNAGKQQEALNYLQEKFNNGGERFKSWLPTVTGISRAAWEAQKQSMEGLIMPWQQLDGDAAKYHKTMVNLGTIFDGVWTSVTNTVLEGIVKLTGSEGLEGLNEKAHKFADNFKTYFDNSVIPKLKETFEEAKAIIDWFNKQGTIRDFGQGGRLRPEEFIRRQNEDEQNKNFSPWDWLKKQLGVGGEDGDGATLPKNAKPRSFSPDSVIDVQKDSNRSLQDMRDLIQKWDDQIQGGVGAVPGGGAGGGGGGAGGAGGGGGSGEASPGGPAGLNDEGGKKIDPETMRQAEILGRAGDVAGLQKLFSQKGYRMSGPACGMVAAGYVKSAGYKPPTGAAIATSWHKWGEKLNPDDINAPNHPFGSMVSTYFHGRYGGTQGQILAPGQTGGHVMTIVPGSYNKADGTAIFADQYGARRRKLTDMDTRFAGASTVAAVEASHGDRDKIDRALGAKAASSPWNASLNVNLKNVPEGVKTDAGMGGVFNTLKINRSNQFAYE